MKGYFSRIANQSGLRFSSKGAISPSRAKKSHAGLPSEPLDREETLTVPSTVESKSSEAGALKGGTSSVRPVSENNSLKPDRKKAMAKSDSKQVLPSSVPESTTPLVDEKSVFIVPEPESYQKKQIVSSDESQVLTPSETVSAEIVQSVLVSPSGVSEQHEKQSPDPSRAVTIEPDASGENREKHYFTRTAEVIGGGAAEPVEVQTILLHEIQEWAAEGITKGTATDKSVESGVINSETETKEFVRKTQPEVGAVRIGEKRQQAPIQQMDSRIDEQNFDLSIGTISVVIEGDERPPQPEPAPRADNRKNGHDIGRERSRLSRNYL